MQKRHVLWCLPVFQMTCNTLVTQNINIAIVSMVSNHNPDESITKDIVCPNTTFFLKNLYKDVPQKSSNNIKTGYDWSEAEQNRVLSGYYWLNYFSIFPGGILAHKFGSKRIVGLVQSISSIMSSLIPFFADSGSTTVSWIRAIQGFLSFMSVPAGMYTIIGNWSPPQERGWFGATFIIGTTIGLSGGSFCFGYIGQYIHWKYIFHLTSICGIIWTVLWYNLVYDSPRQHPTISFDEKEFIEESLKKSQDKNKVSIPWKSIINSIPVIIGILASNSVMWVFVMMATYIPMYLKTIYGFNSNEIGVITSLSLLLAGIQALAVAFFCGICAKKDILSTTQIRKVCSFIGGITISIPLIIIAYTKCNASLVVICILITWVLKVADTFGPLILIVDLSPKFCGILEGFSGTSSSIQTFIYSWVINYFTGVWDIEEVWKMAFLFTALYAAVANTLFIIFGTAKVQKWNFENTDDLMNEEKSNNNDTMGISSLMAN